MPGKRAYDSLKGYATSYESHTSQGSRRSGKSLNWSMFRCRNPGPGQALVRLAASGVNFIDIYFRTGLYKADSPIAIGSEGSGTVEAVGEGVTEVAPGDRVAYAMARGSYAEYAVVPAAQLVKIPAHVDFQTAAAAMLQGMTAHYLTHSTFPLKAGDTCLVHAAAGGAGGLIVQMAKNLGARVFGTVSTAGEGEDCARVGGRRSHPLHGTGVRCGGAPPDRRPRRGCGVRFRGQDHVREESELAAAARHARALRSIERLRCLPSTRRCSMPRARCS